MEQKLLEQALNSILHGSVSFIAETDSYGNMKNREVKVNDLRINLVKEIAEKLVYSPGFKEAVDKAFTQEAIAMMLQKISETMKFSDLPYALRDRIEKDMKEAKVEVKRYKIIAESVSE